MATPLDRIDRKIAAALTEDASLPVARIADRVGPSQTPCWERIQKREAAGVILGRSAVVDPARIGFGFTACVEIAAADDGGDGRAARGHGGPPPGGRGGPPPARRGARHGPFDAVHPRLTDAAPIEAVTSRFAMERIASRTAHPIDVHPR